MSLGSFRHALQFLTRLPGLGAGAPDADSLSRAAVWFAPVGLIVGAALAGAVWAGAHVSPLMGALLGLAVWVWISGGLHLDGLGDVADALAAAHRTPERILEVLRDPHVGAFGVIAIALQLIAKLVLLSELAGATALVALVLVPAWARLGAPICSLAVPALADGSGARFARHIDAPSIAIEGVVLAIVSVWLAPALLAAFVIVPGIAAFWHYRLGGITGDCLGAGIEAAETLLLLALVIAAA